MPPEALELKAPPEAFYTKTSPKKYEKNASNGDYDDRKISDLLDVVYDTCCRRG